MDPPPDTPPQDDLPSPSRSSISDHQRQNSGSTLGNHESQVGSRKSSMLLTNLENFFKHSLPHMSLKRHTDDVVEVRRPVFNLDHFDVTYGYARSTEPLNAKVKRFVRKQCTCTKARLWSILVSFFPILSWIREYNWKTDPISDLMAGLTVGIMSIPQGMSYAGLVSIPPQYGLYTNLVPTIVYFFVGTARHAAIGTAAVVSLMMGTIRLKQIPNKAHQYSVGCHSLLNSTWNESTPLSPEDSWILNDPNCYTAPELAMATSMLTGVLLAVLGCLRLGFVSAYLSDYLVGGFTSGAAVFVLTSQLDYIVGFHLHAQSGPGKIFRIYAEFFTRIKEVNVATFVVAIVTAAFLLIVKEGLNPMFQKRFRLPIPGELLAVIIGTIASYFGKFNDRYHVDIVKNIPSGFPVPVAVRFDIMGPIFVDALVLAIVNYSLSVSLAKLYAKRNNYRINPYQEFFAYSAINIIGSTFQSFPSGQSVARSIVYESAGAKSQFAGLIGTICVVVCVLWLAPFLAALPQSILGAIILVACVEMLQQLKQLGPLWRASKIDFSIYMVTFVAVVLLDVTYGLAASVLYAFLTVIVRTQCPRVRLMGRVGETDLYSDVDRYQRTSQLPGVKVFHYHAPLYYANVENFKPKLYKLCNVDPALIKAERLKQERVRAAEEKKMIRNRSKSEGHSSRVSPPVLPRIVEEVEVELPPAVPPIDRPHHVIIDCSGFSYVDLMGVNALKQVFTELKDIGITVFFADCNASVRKILEKSQFYHSVPKKHLFVSVHDAVLEASRIRSQTIQEVSSIPQLSQAGTSQVNDGHESTVASEDLREVEVHNTDQQSDRFARL